MPDLRHRTKPTIDSGVTAAAGLCGAGMLGVFGAGSGLPVAVATGGLVALAVVDLRTHRIPNRALAAAMTATLVVTSMTASAALAPAGLLAAAWVAVLATIHLLDPGLGFGDVKLSVLLGAAVGLACHATGRDMTAGALVSAAALLAACLLTAPFARRDTATPFAPALVGTVLTAVIGLGVTG